LVVPTEHAQQTDGASVMMRVLGTAVLWRVKDFRRRVPLVTDSLIHSRVALVRPVRASLIGRLIIGGRHLAGWLFRMTNSPLIVRRTRITPTLLWFSPPVAAADGVLEAKIYDPRTNGERSANPASMLGHYLRPTTNRLYRYLRVFTQYL